jgi:uncharacterized protein (DUF1800 family)
MAARPEDFGVIPRGKEAATLALHRFGFGPIGVAFAPFSIATLAADPRGALLAELDRPTPTSVAANLPSSAEAARAVSDFRAEDQASRKLAQRAQKQADARDGSAMATAGDAGRAMTPPINPAPMNAAPTTAAAMTGAPTNPKVETKELPLPQRLFQDEAAVHLNAAVGANIGFVERLVWFWSNHFCISADKDIAMVGAYEREAIRPYVLAHFGDMLAAVEGHPAMLFYLDNVQSMGADSIAGINRDKGLNENLAREILELHTLGVRSGYSQSDVTSFANVLTGWTWIDPNEPAHGGEFLFNKRLHQPGDKTVLGKLYADTGVEQGRAVLADLARNFATAQHIAGKLARHFVADDAPPMLVAKLAKTFNDTGGNLKELARTLVTADEAWAPQRAKLKKPSEWLIGTLRLASANPYGSISLADPTRANVPRAGVGRILNFQAVLGEPLWRPPAPNGYPDTDAAWIDGVPRRLDIANQLAGQLPADVDPLDLLERAVGPLASADTRQTIARAESRTQAFALLVMAPEFLRR